MPFRLRIPRRFYDRMLQQAVAELPNECCGFLGGRLSAEGRDGLVLECYPLGNGAQNPERQYFGTGLFLPMRDMRERELDLLAIYHSHPTSRPVPSRTDLEQNYYPDTMHLIISLETSPPLMRGWWLSESDFSEGVWQIDESLDGGDPSGGTS